MKAILTLFFIGVSLFSFAQENTHLRVLLDDEQHTLHVEQTLEIKNTSNKVLTDIYLHAWINAYSGRLTPLNEIKIEDRKSDLHFATSMERGGVKDLKIYINHQELSYEFEEREFIKVRLNEALKLQETKKFELNYTIKIPTASITQYGYNGKDYLLKYFFIEPAPIENNEFVLQHYKDFESVFTPPMNYTLKMIVPKGFQVYSDLKQENQIWKGDKRHPFFLFVTPDISAEHTIHSSNKDILIQNQDILENLEPSVLDGIYSQQFDFLQEFLGDYPLDKMVFNRKMEKNLNWFGLDDLDAIFFKIKFFTEEQQTDLRILKLVIHQYLEALFLTNNRKDHWIKNGLAIMLQMKYVEKYYPELNLLGSISDDFKLLGLKPLKWFHATKVPMNDRYKLLYLFTVRQNYDQPILTPMDELSNLNQISVSGFKTGISFLFINEYLGNDEFFHLMKNFIHANNCCLITANDFRNYILLNASKPMDWYFDGYLSERKKVNFKILKFTEKEDEWVLKVKRNNGENIPFQVVGVKNDSIVKKEWYANSSERIVEVKFPKGDYDYLEINPDYLFPEYNDRDNRVRTKGLFKNSKKLQFKLFADVDNVAYNQIFFQPQFRWNNYDKFLIGMQFNNRSPLPRNLYLSVVPRYSTGTNQILGSVSGRYNILPESGIFRRLTFSGGYRTEHYDVGLSFEKLSAGFSFDFNKRPRTTESHGMSIFMDDVYRETSPGIIREDSDDYQLYNMFYYYSNPHLIHDFNGNVGFQMSEVFKRITGQAYYRFRFDKKKVLGARLFFSKFIDYQGTSNFFNVGISQVSDFAFAFQFLGRSEGSGILSQQYFLGDGGFKSLFNEVVNDWIVSTNLEYNVWKIFDVYADAGFYKNQGQRTEFIYDSGLRVQIIPEFLEFYFPIQSSLGFEPAMDNYLERIRFTLNLNLGAIINVARRGFY